MIGGEFDLSSGVAVTTSSLAASMLAYNLHLNLWVGAGLALMCRRWPSGSSTATW